MPRRAKLPVDPETIGDKIIGLGECSFQKSHCPEFQQRLSELERFRLLLDQTNDAIFLMRVPSGALVDVNETSCSALGYPRPALLTKSFSDFLPPGVFAHVEAFFWEEQPGASKTITTFIKLEDGRDLPVEITLRLVTLSDGVYAVGVARDLTQRQIAQEALQRTEQEFRAVVGNIPAVVFKGHHDGTMHFFDNRVEAMTGYSRDEFESHRRQWLDLIFPEDLGAAWQGFIKALQGSGAYVREYRIQTKGGETIWVQERSSIVRDPEGQVDYISGVLFDITARKRGEEALTESEARYRNIFDHAVEGIFQSTPQGSFLNVNPALAEMYGYESPEALTCAITDILHQIFVDPGRCEELQRLMARDGFVKGFEYEAYHQNGNRLWMSQNARSVRDDQGNILYYEGFVENITLRKRVEAALRDSEEKYRRMMETANDAILVADSDTGIIVDANQKAEELLGLPQAQIIGVSQNQVHPPEEAERYQNIFQEHAKRGGLVTGLSVKHSAGHLIPVEISAGPYRAADKNLVQGIFRDISERQQAEKQLRLAAQKWRSTFDAMRDAVCLLDGEGKVLQCNQAMASLVERPFNELIGRSCCELTHGFSEPTEDCPLIRMATSHRMESLVIPWGDRWLETTVDPIFNESGNLTGAVYIISDITERQHATDKISNLNTLLKAIKDINEALLRVQSESELFQQTCDLLVQVPYLKFVWIGLVQPGSYDIKLAAHAGYEQDYLATLKVTWDNTEFGRGPTGEAIRTRQPVVIKDMQTDPRLAPWRVKALERGYRAAISLPLVHQTEVFGILKAYSGKPDAFGPEEVEFLSQVTGDIMVGFRSLQLSQGLETSLRQLRAVVEQTVEAIASMAELRDPYTAGHQRGVTQLACALAADLGLETDRIEGIRVAGFLHDIGKIIIPAEILNKPGKLSQYEFNLIRTHSQAGYDILQKIDFPWPVAQIVLQHHERLNGSGYPHGLTQSEILLEARILAVADVVEAMAAHRPYRPSLGIEAALEEITQNKGILYDPGIVDTCVQLIYEKGFNFS
jgi:PAS domain S-box-containing protein/putative nucleotidyltransferase with HDIG domain